MDMCSTRLTMRTSHDYAYLACHVLEKKFQHFIFDSFVNFDFHTANSHLREVYGEKAHFKVVFCHDTPDYVVEFVQLSGGVSTEQIVYLPAPDSLGAKMFYFEHLFVPVARNSNFMLPFPAWALSSLHDFRRKILKLPTPSVNLYRACNATLCGSTALHDLPCDKMFISRRSRSGTGREITNAKQLEKDLLERGFAICDITIISTREKIFLFRLFSHIVVQSGAGVANTVLMRPGSHVHILEHPKFRSDWYDKSNFTENLGVGHTRIHGLGFLTSGKNASQISVEEGWHAPWTLHNVSAVSDTILRSIYVIDHAL
jgi:hypothetical protein